MKYALLVASLALAGCSQWERNWQASQEAPKHPVSRGGVPVLVEMPGSSGVASEPALSSPQADHAMMTDSTTGVSAAPTMPRAPTETEATPEPRSERMRPAPRKKAAVAMAPRAPRMSREVALNYLHHINQREIAMAELAKKESSAAGVHRVADRVMADHREWEKSVEAAAERQNIKLHSFQLATYEAAAMESLEAKDGAEFDRAYLAAVEDGHRLNMRAMRMVRSGVRDAQIRSVIDSAMPEMRAHSQLSRGVNRARN